MDKKIDINDLKFGVVTTSMSYSRSEDKYRLESGNLFGYSRVKVAVANFVTMGEDRRREISDPLMYCFADVWGRTEWEFIVCPWPFDAEDKVSDVGQKVDVYTMYVEPNRELLLGMISQVSESSAKKYLAEWRKAHRRK